MGSGACVEKMGGKLGWGGVKGGLCERGCGHSGLGASVWGWSSPGLLSVFVSANFAWRGASVAAAVLLPSSWVLQPRGVHAGEGLVWRLCLSGVFLWEISVSRGGKEVPERAGGGF